MFHSCLRRTNDFILIQSQFILRGLLFPEEHAVWENRSRSQATPLCTRHEVRLWVTLWHLEDRTCIF